MDDIKPSKIANDLGNIDIKILKPNFGAGEKHKLALISGMMSHSNDGIAISSEERNTYIQHVSDTFDIEYIVQAEKDFRTYRSGQQCDCNDYALAYFVGSTKQRMQKELETAHEMVLIERRRAEREFGDITPVASEFAPTTGKNYATSVKITLGAYKKMVAGVTTFVHRQTEATT